MILLQISKKILHAKLGISHISQDPRGKGLMGIISQSIEDYFEVFSFAVAVTLLIFGATTWNQAHCIDQKQPTGISFDILSLKYVNPLVVHVCVIPSFRIRYQRCLL
jgi:hypothetical protein